MICSTKIEFYMYTKKKIIPAALTCLLITVALVFANSGTIQNNKLQSQVVTGTPLTTDNMHNVEIGGYYDSNVYGEFANSWFKKYTLTVSAPAGWYFTGKPYIHCSRDDQGAFAWNNFVGSPDRFYVTQQTPTFIQATVWAGSRSIVINLACEATKK
jgi:hypothetical protein